MHLLARASWFLVACMGPIIDAAGVLEVDLVFPRNDTYAPTPDMPVVFAFQNAELARFLNPYISYKIRNWDDSSWNDSVSFHHDLSWTNWSSHDPYFVYHYFDEFNTEGRWWLTWTVSWQSCDEGWLSDPFVQSNHRRMISNSSSWSNLFTTENSGQEVDLVAATTNKPCPEELGVAINVTDKTMEVPYWVDWSGGETCAVVAPPTLTPTPDPCRVKIDSAVVASISASVLATQCKSLYPPANCPAEDDKSAAQRLVVGGVACFGGCIRSVWFHSGVNWLIRTNSLVKIEQFMQPISALALRPGNVAKANSNDLSHLARLIIGKESRTCVRRPG
ncbi:hypothetical protein DL765_003813 [Monosporascus sp. GIB2]|nr:hypothetical protein DL765_003813 [Monosporascus sp. GIB2]